MHRFDPHGNEVQYLEDLATAYWNSELLFSAVELEIFECTEQPKTLEEVCGLYGCDKNSMERFLAVLITMGLLTKYDGLYLNSEISNTYLMKGKEMYQGDSILWRKELKSQWDELTETIRRGKRIRYVPDDNEKILYERTKRYISAMDAIVKSKVKEIISIFGNIEIKGNILDVGAGSGGFSLELLKEYPQVSATLFDLENVIKIDQDKYKGINSIQYHIGNILEKWNLQNSYQVIILSNILHAYSEEEVDHILRQAIQKISPTGYIIIHDFFMDHSVLKAGLSDLNMMINTYNGKVFRSQWICKRMEELGLQHSGLIPLEGDTGVIFASHSDQSIQSLCMDKSKILMQKITNYGFHEVKIINPKKDVSLTNIAPLKCEYGCEFYTKGTCQSKNVNLEKTKALLHEFNSGILLEGEPPTKDFQVNMLKVEKEAFKLGFYKAFVLWAGPCSLCKICKNLESSCSKTRPAMESYGIDVFKTVRKQGLKLKTLDNREYVKYFGLLLLE